MSNATATHAPAPAPRAPAAPKFPKPPASAAAAKPGLRRTGRRIMVYGEGGTGKTTMALRSTLVGETAFIDLEGTLFSLLGDEAPETLTPYYPESWEQILAVLDGLIAYATAKQGARSVVIDSLTAAETMLDEYVLAHFTPNKGGFGKVDFHPEGNPQPLASLNELGGGGDSAAKYPAFNVLLARLDSLARLGVNVIVVCHEAPTDVADLVNGGQVFRRAEPRLMTTANGKNSLRLRAVEWCDDVLHIYAERVADKDSKAEHRTGDVLVAFAPDNGYVAKSRTLSGEPQSRDEFRMENLLTK